MRPLTKPNAMRRLWATTAIVAALGAACAADRPPPVPAPEPIPLPTYSGSQAPAPAQWAGPGPGVPTNRWWSSALVGPGTQPMWPQPLAAQITAEGELRLSHEEPQSTPGGAVVTPFVPALAIRAPGAADLRVVDSGPLHVTMSVSGRDGEAFRVTLAQGSPFAELVVQRPVTISGWAGAPPSAAQFSIAVRGRQWVGAVSGSARLQGQGPDLELVPARPTRLALGPVPADTTEDWAALAAATAAAPLARTTETLSIDSYGAVTQTLGYDRGGAASIIALLPHQQARVSPPAKALGSFTSAAGLLQAERRRSLVLRYDAVPVLWNAAPAAPAELPETDQARLREPIVAGSYFGGKQAWTVALLVDLDGGAKPALIERLRDQLAPLRDNLAFDARYGTVIMIPSEFGADTELNDHNLQYGYWVAAASVLAERDPQWAREHQAAIDALIDDYAGDPDPRGQFPASRAWNAYGGHSHASGLAPFGDGNNLESTSESMFAWWAAARWYVVTGRRNLAATSLARLTIESWVSRTQWLPDEPLSAANARPWSGVVWSAKTDPGTFFDARPEAALGIKLLPLGPNSLARYPDAASVAAAASRWRWCDAHGGCTALWPNLLDSDAAVAGRPALGAGGDDERSTSTAAAAWWREIWNQSSPIDSSQIRCTPGAVARRKQAGAVEVIASNPAPSPAPLRCATSKRTVWSATLAPGASASATGTR